MEGKVGLLLNLLILYMGYQYPNFTVTGLILIITQPSIYRVIVYFCYVMSH